MPQFHCPSCGVEAQVGEAFAGKRIVCPECQQSAVVPTNADATPQGITTPELAHGPLRRAEDELPEAPPSIREPNIDGGWFAWLTPGKVIVGISLVLLGTFVVASLPGLHRTRCHEGRIMDVNNLKNIGLAFHGFHDANKRLPFNGSDDAVGNQPYAKEARPKDLHSGSWAFQILPYIDQAPLFIEPHARVGVFAYMSPARARPMHENAGGPWVDFFYNNYLNDPDRAAKPDAADKRRRMIEITDGTSNTIMVGHGQIDTRQYASNANVTLSINIYIGGTFGTARAGDNGAVAPRGITLQRDTDRSPTPGSWGGPYPQGAIMCMGDAAVRMFPYETKNFSAFLTPTGNEAEELPDG